MPARQPIVQLHAVTVVRDGADILSSVDWEVHEGERWVVLGPNGSGKTTLLEVASTYTFPSRGRARVLGGVFGQTDVRDLRPRIGYASATLERMMAPNLTVLTTVATGKHALLRSWRETYDEHDWARSHELLERFGIAGLADRPVGSLSEGERRRVHLARSLMADPDLWLLDEPTAGLDVGAREQLLGLLEASANSPRPRATVFVTHHVEEIPSGFTHLALLRGGKVLAAGPLSKVLEAGTLSECFATPLCLEHRHGRWWAWGPPQESDETRRRP